MDNEILYGTVLRFHNQEDIDAIAELEKAIFNPPWSKTALSDFASYDTNKILVASLDNKVIGYITFSFILDEIQIANVATHPDYRRKGIAQALLKSLRDIGTGKNAEIITLEVRQSNDSAIKLYEKMGYEKVGMRKNFYSNPIENAILMNYAFERNI